MNAAAPDLSVAREGEALWVAYRTARRDHFAVLRFSGVAAASIDQPRDDPPADPLLSATAARPGAFHEVHDPAVRPPLRRWIITTPDDAVAVTAREARVLVRAIQAPSASHAIGSLRA